MVLAKELFIPEIFMLRNPGNLRQFQRTRGVSFLKGVRILINNDYHLVCLIEIQPNEWILLLVASSLLISTLLISRFLQAISLTLHESLF